MSFSGLSGYLNVPPETELTTPAGFSNLMCQGILPALMTTERDEKPEVVDDLFRAGGGLVLRSWERKRYRLKEIRSKELGAALGRRSMFLGARGVAAIPPTESTSNMKARVAADRGWKGNNPRKYISYSLNVSKAANSFAARADYAMKERDKTSALSVRFVSRDEVISWGSDSESGPLNEAEVLVRPQRTPSGRFFILSPIPLRGAHPCSRDTRMEFSLGFFIKLLGSPSWWDYGFGDLVLHPLISQRSREMLKVLELQPRLEETKDPRTWYEV